MTAKAQRQRGQERPDAGAQCARASRLPRTVGPSHPVSAAARPLPRRALRSVPVAPRPQYEPHGEDLDLVRHFAQRVRAEIGTAAVAVRWFGSRRTGNAAPDSDVDVLLETKAPLTPAQRDLVLDTSVEMAGAYGRLLDVHYYTSRDLRSPRLRATPFIVSVLSEGMIV